MDLGLVESLAKNILSKNDLNLSKFRLMLREINDKDIKEEVLIYLVNENDTLVDNYLACINYKPMLDILIKKDGILTKHDICKYKYPDHLDYLSKHCTSNYVLKNVARYGTDEHRFNIANYSYSNQNTLTEICDKTNNLDILNLILERNDPVLDVRLLKSFDDNIFNVILDRNNPTVLVEMMLYITTYKKMTHLIPEIDKKIDPWNENRERFDFLLYKYNLSLIK